MTKTGQAGLLLHELLYAQYPNLEAVIALNGLAFSHEFVREEPGVKAELQGIVRNLPYNTDIDSDGFFAISRSDQLGRFFLKLKPDAAIRFVTSPDPLISTTGSNSFRLGSVAYGEVHRRCQAERIINRSDWRQPTLSDLALLDTLKLGQIQAYQGLWVAASGDQPIVYQIGTGLTKAVESDTSVPVICVK